ncbi:HAD-superfamily hydrolase, subfamily IA, variant 3 [Thalassoporum mexicanum PCC 7367]|uniref:HAD family hydrolase n=1 Tax=Thalassoporum mexicanum TaxID=3457544 RepID=UPI00029FD31D|nr:HAD family phosphatase [Pseudanabaena sp. PCC 7367]AFY68715.1 HAD-superfamily hydrolase, subfamily IA, variant 3 [Pseudanabaena sp. PCC 7367]
MSDPQTFFNDPNSIGHLQQILFDLGGVLYELDFAKFGEGMNRLRSPQSIHSIEYSLRQQPEVFSLFETGKISTAEFRDRLRSEFKLEASDEAIDHAWNSLLVGLYGDRVGMLAKLKKKYRLSLLSNINDLHLNAVEHECKELFALFEQCFFSHLIGLRKPNQDVFEHVLAGMAAQPEQVLYIDDSPQHVETAKSMGINAIHLANANDLKAICDRLLVN